MQFTFDEFKILVLNFQNLTDIPERVPFHI